MSKSLDRLTLLETFIRIAETGSLSAAARDLGLSQPSVSRQLVDLEKRLKTQLVRRSTHQLALTESGIELLRDARQMVSAWDAIEERHADANEIVKGKLKIVAPVALGQSYLAQFISEFQLAYPSVHINWQLEDAAIRFTEVGCDCWIKIGPVNDDTLIVRPIATVTRMLVASPALVKNNTYQAPDELANLPMISLAPFEGERIPLQDKQGNKIEFKGASIISTNNILSVKEAVLMGAGMAVMPKWFVEDELQSGKLVDILPQYRAPTLTIHIAYLPNPYQPKRLKVFIEALKEKISTIQGINLIAE